MAKGQSFAAKVSKGVEEGSKCSKCGEIMNTVMVVSSQKNDKKGGWRFKEQFVPVCKCNENDVYA